MGRTFASMKYHNYRIWFFASLVANTGSWMQRVAQDWLVLAILTNDDAFAVGLVTALQFLPLLFLMPIAGIWADRFNKQKILVTTQTLMALLAFGLGALVLTGHANVTWVCIFAVGLGAVAAFDNPTRQVFVSELVAPKDLPNAVGLNSTSFNLARLIGPGVAGLLIAATGPGWVFIINGASFIPTIIALIAMRRSEFFPLTSKKGAARSRGALKEGLRYVSSRGDLRLIFIVTGTVACLGLNFQITTAAMARLVFDKQAGEYGILGSVLAIGSLTGALLAARRRNQPRVRIVIAGAIAFAAAAGINAVMPTYELYALSLVPVGLAMLTLLTSANTAVQMSTEQHMRGRVMGLYQTVMQGSAPIGSLIVGWICENVSPRWGIGIGPIAAIVAVIFAYAWSVKRWNLDVSYHVHRPLIEIRGPREHEEEEQDDIAHFSAHPERQVR